MKQALGVAGSASAAHRIARPYRKNKGVYAKNQHFPHESIDHKKILGPVYLRQKRWLASRHFRNLGGAFADMTGQTTESVYRFIHR
jgi:hypothetical protein